MEILKKEEYGYEIEIKRFYLPFVLKKKCDCGEILEIDLEQDYLSYPIVNDPTEVIFYCDECENQYEEKVLLKINLELV